MNKLLLLVAAVLLLVVVGAGVQWYAKGDRQAAAFDPLNTTYMVDGTSFMLVNGSAEREAAPGSASRMSLEVFGEPVATHDLDGADGADAALILQYSGGGTGVFYYAAAALSGANGTETSNTILLGDRIAIQNIQIQDGGFIVNYADRKPGEPMTATPSVGVSRYFEVEGRTLTETPAGAGSAATEYKWNFAEKPEDSDGIPSTNVTLTAGGRTRNLGTHQGTCFIIETSAWDLLVGETSGVICWWAGGGTELGVFREGSKTVVKKGELSEGDAETEGFRGNFAVVAEL